MRAAANRASRYQAAEPMPTKKPMGQFVRYDRAIALQTVSSARTAPSASAGAGCRVSARAAAGGPTMRLNMSRAPTTGTAAVVASATRARKSISIRAAGMPRASATSGSALVSSSGR